ncbi:MFS transporter [Hungatella effluvii]|uniref:MFS transporter n=1 Tax=Hungatella effluvii TaxID=1096246 RepID=UPI002A82EFAF|nr:MFS transporter [Hungatella effluvii]
MKTWKKAVPFLCFAVLMFGLGSSDSLRGIFAPVFQNRYALSDTQLSLIVTISYVGNLLFLSLGGKLLDTFGRKTVVLSVTAIWVLSMLLNLVSDSYICILISMFFALGASTLLNTTVNILTPVVFSGYAGLMVNIFFFIQGIGTSGSQFVLGRYGLSYPGFKGVSFLLLLIGAAAGFLLILIPLGGEKQPEHLQSKGKTEAPVTQANPKPAVFILLCTMIGFYFIGEHGIMNCLFSYCIQAFQLPSGKASVYLSLFWGGMTAGRLIFAPVVQRQGTVKSIRIFGTVGTLLFCAGILIGENGILLLSISGLAISVLYPTMVLLIQQIYPAEVVATRTGAIISVATVADIVFNLFFGVITGASGYRLSFMILPACMVGFNICYMALQKYIWRNVE